MDKYFATEIEVVKAARFPFDLHQNPENGRKKGLACRNAKRIFYF